MKTRKLVLDASVIAKWYNKEMYSENAHTILKEYVSGRVELLEPTLVLYEVGNAVVKNRQLTVEDCRKSMKSLYTLLKDVLVEVGEESLVEIVEMARKLKLTLYDTVYVYLAAVNNATLVTADNKQYEGSQQTVKTIHLKNYTPRGK